MKALVFDSNSINRFLSGADFPAEWWKHYQFGDSGSQIYTFFRNDVCYVLANDSSAQNPRLVIKLDDRKLFGGFEDETDRIEALHRCLSGAQRFFEGKSHPLPLSWKPFSRSDITTFQSNNRTSGENRRISARFSTSGLKTFFAYDLTSRQSEFDSSLPDQKCFEIANAQFSDALGNAKRHFSTVHTAVEDIPLRATLLPSIPANAQLTDIITNHLTNDQKRFVRLPLSPIRLSGVAGTGKTFAMVIKFLHEAYSKMEKNETFRFLFLTHNTTARDLVDTYILHLDSKRIIDSNSSGAVLQTDTLLNLAYQYLAAELTDIEPVSIDAHIGKSMEIDFISDIVENYRKGLWLTRRNRTSDQMRRWISAEKGSAIHRGFCWDVMNEIACSLDAENIRDIQEKRKKYVNNARSRSVMRLEMGGDREVLLDLYVDASHSPFLSRPADLAQLLVEATTTTPIGSLRPDG